MSPFRLLITKKISPALISFSGLKGVDIMEKELIKIVPLNTKEIIDKIRNLYSSEATVAFTSKNAVTIVADAVKDGNPSLPDWKIYCLEGLTREEVIKHFSKDLIAGTARNARSLATEIQKNATGRKIIFFCGNKRRDELPDILKDNGIQVEELIVYETEFSPVKIVDDFAAVVFFSPSAVESFFSVNGLDEKVVCFSVGRTTTEAIKRFAGNRIITSEKTSEESIMESVMNYVSVLRTGR